jgi:effector-binding domain-containing protein
MSAIRHHVHTNLGLDVTAVEDEHVPHARTMPRVDPFAREEMLEGWLPDHGTNFGIVLPIDESDQFDEFDEFERGAAGHEVVITTLPAVRVLAVEEQAAMASVGEAMQSAFGRLFGAVERAGVAVTGPPFSRYPEMPSEQVRFELCAPIAPEASVEATAIGADVQDVVVPERHVATLRFRGAYEAMGPAWQRLLSWVADHDRRIVGPLEEAYLDDPEACGPEGPETLMIIPIA